MDFARKQLEKFGWKEGSGLGKNSQGMVQAIKPTLKTGKEGMGFDFSKELVDTWWTRAYDDSLNRINVETDNESSEIVGVTLKDDDDERPPSVENSLVQSANAVVERPFEKMRKRMMKATFTTFSKGATLSNGEMITEAKSDSEDTDEEDTKKKSKQISALTDEQLFKACGGRTAHKAARFGLKLNGKLARIAAQEEAAKVLLLSNSPSHSKNIDKSDDVSGPTPVQEPSSSLLDKLKKKKKKKSKKSKDISEQVDEDNITEAEPTPSSEVNDSQETFEDSLDSKKNRKKHKKRKYTELDSDSISHQNTENTNDLTETEESISSNDKKSHKKKNKKSKKLKVGRNADKDEESHALLSE